jgi:hypothetical protein
MGWDNFEKLERLVPLRHPEKRKRLRDLRKSMRFRRRSRRNWPLAELRDLYAEGLSYQECAEHFGCSIGTIARWAKVANLKVRTACEAQQLCWDRGRRAVQK